MSTLTLLEEFALLALLKAGDDGLAAGGIASEIKTLIPVKAADLGASCRRVEELGLAGKIMPRPRSIRWRISHSGRETAERLRGQTPSRGRGWLGKAGRKRIAARALHLDDRHAAAVAANVDALAACLLAGRLGWTFEPGTTAQSLARDVAAQELAAANAQPSSLLRALLERALSSDATQPPVAPTAAGETVPAEPFAVQIAHAARTTPDKAWFGPRKLFIHHAWEAWRRNARDSGTDLAAFKLRLLTALRAGELGLTRADLPDAIAPADLAASETRYGTETFHFITAENPHTP